MAATLRIDGPATQADGYEIDTTIVVDEQGQHAVAIHFRRPDSSKVTTYIFEAYDYERLKEAFKSIDVTLAKLQERGAVFRMG
jgi:hypothetical protein